MKALFSIFTMVFAGTLSLAQLAYAGCPDETFIFSPSAITFDGPSDGRVHTPGTGPNRYRSVDSFSTIDDLKATIQKYAGYSDCVDLMSCTDSSGEHDDLKTIAVYEGPLVGGMCTGNMLYFRRYAF